MRPAIEVYQDAIEADVYLGQPSAVAVIEADREALVREICEMLRAPDLRQFAYAADLIERKYLGKDA